MKSVFTAPTLTLAVFNEENYDLHESSTIKSPFTKLKGTTKYRLSSQKPRACKRLFPQTQSTKEITNDLLLMLEKNEKDFELKYNFNFKEEKPLLGNWEWTCYTSSSENL